MFCTDNDVEDNSYNARHGGFYKPYYTVQDDLSLKLNGVPVPRSEKVIRAEHPILFGPYVMRALLRAYCQRTAPPIIQVQKTPTQLILQYMRYYVFSKGSFFVMGVQDGSRFPKLMEFLQERSISHADITSEHKYPGLGGHWTSEGHALACQQLDRLIDAIRKAGYRL